VIHFLSIIEKSRKYNIEMYLCFVDYSKRCNGTMDRWNVGWSRKNNMIYADDTVIIVASKEELKEIMARSGKNMAWN